jgi:hypothetical protein
MPGSWIRITINILSDSDTLMEHALKTCTYAREHLNQHNAFVNDTT